MSEPPVELIVSLASFGVTAYFWLIQARRERPQLRIYQVGGFRAVCRRHPQRDDASRLCVQQMDNCGVLIANNSIRQNSIVLFDCWLLLPDGRQIRGDWGSVGEDRPPWNIGPESSIALGLGCFFDVPQEFELPKNFEIGVEFISASGRRYAHTFSREAPVTNATSKPFAKKAA